MNSQAPKSPVNKDTVTKNEVIKPKKKKKKKKNDYQLMLQQILKPKSSSEEKDKKKILNATGGARFQKVIKI